MLVNVNTTEQEPLELQETVGVVILTVSRTERGIKPEAMEAPSMKIAKPANMIG